MNVSQDMISFDAEHAAVHYPPDRRFRTWIRSSFLLIVAAAVSAKAIWANLGSTETTDR